MEDHIKEIPTSKEQEFNNLDSSQLYKELQEKNELIKKYELKFKQLREDFNYNVELIYQRDKDIEMQNIRIDELIALNKEKDFEIQSLQQYCSRVKQLEHDKIVLTKRYEALLAANYKIPIERQFSTPKIDKSKFQIDYRGQMHSKHLSMDKSYNKLEEDNIQPLSKLNFELQRRIKALEQETNINGAISSDKLSEEESDDDHDIAKTRAKVQIKEREISDLIKSLHPYKLESNNCEVLKFDQT